MYDGTGWDAIGALLGRLSVGQRAVLGLPPPGHPFWTEETIEAVAARHKPEPTMIAGACGSDDCAYDQTTVILPPVHAASDSSTSDRCHSQLLARCRLRLDGVPERDGGQRTGWPLQPARPCETGDLGCDCQALTTGGEEGDEEKTKSGEVWQRGKAAEDEKQARRSKRSRWTMRRERAAVYSRLLRGVAAS